VLVSNPYEPGEKAPPAPAPRQRRIFGMTFLQIAVLVFMGLVELCVLGGFIYFISINR
jgi:hypothetical protein